MSRRNIDKHTDAAQVERNIIEAMRLHRCDRQHPANLSSLGFWGFPDYSFKAPQGAALAVSKIVRGMVQRGVIQFAGTGYAIGRAGQGKEASNG